MRRIDHQIQLVLAMLVLIALAVAGSPRQALGRSADRYTTWVARYNDAENDLDTASSVAMSPDGTTVYVAGAAHNCLGDCQYATIAYDAATGSQQWASFYE